MKTNDYNKALQLNYENIEWKNYKIDWCVKWLIPIATLCCRINISITCSKAFRKKTQLHELRVCEQPSNESKKR